MAKASGSGWFSVKVITIGTIGAFILYVAIDFFR
jgi:hypothetical protein